MHDENNEIMGFSKVTRDLTERKKTEISLNEYNKELEAKNQELEEFAYIASHDLQEPLRKIKTFADRLKERSNGSLDETSKLYFDKIIHSADRMSILVREILNYSHLTHLEEKFIETDLNEVLKNVVDDFELRIEQNNAKIEIETLPAVNAIPLQMNQLFHNLLGNGLKFSKEGVETLVQISSRILPKKAIIQYNLNPKSSYCEIIVRDNGIGFKKEHSESIFKIFHRLNNDRKKYEGTGIGLALCRKIVSIHHGEIFAKSRENEGTEIHVILPLEVLPVSS